MRRFTIHEYDVALTYRGATIVVEGVEAKTRISAIREAFKRSGFDKKLWAVSSIVRTA